MREELDSLEPYSRLGAFPEDAPPDVVRQLRLGAVTDCSKIAFKMSPAIDAQARADALAGWQLVFPGDKPSLQEIQAFQAIGRHEGQYGRGWKDHLSPVSGKMTNMAGSNNWGAV